MARLGSLVTAPACRLLCRHTVLFKFIMQRLEHSTAVTSEDLRKQREANAATIQSMLKQYGPKQS